jgi:2-polyprenyl-6-methoxyphenol hydroxylase-like FAD-dependent oxidoreductase
MNEPHDYDAIVVGARLAGSATALLLARQGRRVLLVDRATFPSDTLSTLVIQPAGVAALGRLGVLDAAVAGAPPIERFSFDFGPVTLTGRPSAPDGTPDATVYAPRRTVLDTALVEHAAKAGVEVHEAFTVRDVVIEDGVAVGITGHGPSGTVVNARARIVIGADGWNSIVARAVGAQRYREKPVLENAFYSFWSELPTDGMETYIRPSRGVALIPTNDDLTLMLVGFPFAEATSFRADVERNYHAAVELVPGLAARIGDARRQERFVGGGVPNFFRQSFGPGWALVGDAAYTRDPITAQGISDALTGAESLVDALLQTWAGEDDALLRRQQAHDEDVLPLYELTTQLAELTPPPPPLQQLFARIQGDQEAMDSFVSMTAGTLPPPAFFAQLGVPAPF